jgi:endonuclease YncB( thermonuclease family)
MHRKASRNAFDGTVRDGDAASKPHSLCGRTVAVCFLGSEELNRWMVANGWAVAFRRYSLDYVADEDGARLAGAGLWSSTFQMPWDWRQMQRSR